MKYSGKHHVCVYVLRSFTCPYPMLMKAGRLNTRLMIYIFFYFFFFSMGFDVAGSINLSHLRLCVFMLYVLVIVSREAVYI